MAEPTIKSKVDSGIVSGKFVSKLIGAMTKLELTRDRVIAAIVQNQSIDDQKLSKVKTIDAVYTWGKAEWASFCTEFKVLAGKLSS